MARTKPHTKIHVSVAHHPKTQDAWADLEQRGMLVEVWRLGMERYAGKRGDIIGLTPTDRMSITCQSDQETADKMLSNLFKTVEYSTKRRPNRWDVQIRNFAKKHGFSVPESDTVHVPTKSRNGTHKKEERREKKKERREKMGEKEPGTSPSAPLALEKTDDTWDEINAAFRAYMPRSTGLTLTPARKLRIKKIKRDMGNDDAPIAAIHGYAALHLTKPQDSGFDPMRNFNPETCWGGKIGKYIDADTAARDAGLSRPYQIANSETEFKDRVVQMAEEMRRDNPL